MTVFPVWYGIKVRGRLFVRGTVLFTVGTVVACKEIVLYPYNFAKRFCDGNFPGHFNVWVTQDGFVDGVLNVTQTCSKEDVVDMERVCTTAAKVHQTGGTMSKT